MKDCDFAKQNNITNRQKVECNYFLPLRYAMQTELQQFIKHELLNTNDACEDE